MMSLSHSVPGDAAGPSPPSLDEATVDKRTSETPQAEQDHDQDDDDSKKSTRISTSAERCPADEKVTSLSGEPPTKISSTEVPSRRSSGNAGMSTASFNVGAEKLESQRMEEDGDVVIGQEITCSKCAAKSLLGATSVLWCNECGKAVHTSCIIPDKTTSSFSTQSCPACGKVSLSGVRGGDQQIGQKRSSSSSHSSKSSTPLSESSGQKHPAGSTGESPGENYSCSADSSERRLHSKESASGEKMGGDDKDNDKTVIVNNTSCTNQSSVIPMGDPTPKGEEDLVPPTSVNLSCENSVKPHTRSDEQLAYPKQSSTSSSPTPSWPTEKELTIDSSSEEDDDEDYMNLSHDAVGSENSDLAEELVIKSNSEYLVRRCRSIMKSVQGVMLTSTSRHASRQIQAVVEHPGLNPMLRTSNRNSSSSSYHEIIPPFQRLTKQTLAEVQYAAKLMTNIVRHSMGSSLDPNDDSATEESDTDDDEVVLPDDRMGEVSSLEYNPYLPVENNPFIDAIKVEKEYEIRRTSLDFSINECDYSLTKSLALRKHCKARKPCFQLEKPPASTNVINIPVDATSSNGIVDGDELRETCNRSSSNPTTCLDVSRVSDMMPRRPSQDEAPRTSNSNNNGNICEISPGVISISAKLETASLSSAEPMQTDQDSQQSSGGATTPRTNSQSQPGASQESDVGSESNERHTYFPSIKALGLDGPSVLGVELINCSDPGQSSSRCAAIKRPDKNRKVFQLGGIQNIFRDPARLPTVFCNCYGRDELCALCLGRAKKKAEVNHVFMTNKDKLAILDETFHKTLSFPEDVPLEVLLTSSALGGSGPSQHANPFVTNIQKLIKLRSRKFPPDFLETGPRPKKPRSYDIKPYVESPERSPNKKDGRSSEEAAQSPRKRPARKSQSSFDDKDHHDFTGKGYSRERKDSIRRTRNQEFDIDNIVIPYSMAATTRVEQLVYKPIETPRWRVLEYCEIFAAHKDDKDFGELEDLSNAAFIHRHNKCEVEEKNRFSTALQKAINSTRKTRRVDSIGGSESIGDISVPDDTSSSQLQSLEKTKDTTTPADKDKAPPSTPQVTDNSTVITEAMANQALKSLFKVGRRRTISTSTKVEEEEETDAVVVDPWPQRKFPLPEIEYKDMVEVMHKCYPDCPVGMTSHSSSHSAGPASPSYVF